jgi:hypothetical protein
MQQVYIPAKLEYTPGIECFKKTEKEVKFLHKYQNGYYNFSNIYSNPNFIITREKVDNTNGRPVIIADTILKGNDYPQEIMSNNVTENGNTFINRGMSISL